MLELAPVDDDHLEIPEVGPWSAHKHYFLGRYLDAFTTAMKDKKWSGLHYIDLFAGAGIERIKDGPLQWGSPLIAAQTTSRFTRLHLCELDARRYEALQSRLTRFPQPNPPHLLQADANVAVPEVVAAIPSPSLSLAFLDPYGLHLHYSTLRQLSNRRVDLIIFFPDHLDALRNWEQYADTAGSNLDQVLGTTAWRDEAAKHPLDRRAEVLTQIYVAQIQKLGYVEFEYERIKMPTGPWLYKLIFCSRHKIGGQIWRGISQKKADDQLSLDFGHGS